MLPTNLQQAYSQNWNLSLQKQFLSDWALTVTYLGTRVLHNSYGNEQNPAVYYPGKSTGAPRLLRNALDGACGWNELLHDGKHERPPRADRHQRHPGRLFHAGHTGLHGDGIEFQRPPDHGAASFFQILYPAQQLHLFALPLRSSGKRRQCRGPISGSPSSQPGLQQLRLGPASQLRDIIRSSARGTYTRQTTERLATCAHRHRDYRRALYCNYRDRCLPDRRRQ